MGHCLHCSGQTAYIPEALSDICIECGVLADPSQTVLSIDYDEGAEMLVNASGRNVYIGPQTLHTRTGAALKGQWKEARAQSHAIEATQAIKAVLCRFGLVNLAPRAEWVFNQTMRSREFNRKQFALVVGASIAIAIRESSRGETLYQIADAIDKDVSDLGRVFHRITHLLHLEIPPADPVVLLPLLESYLFNSPCKISVGLQGFLKVATNSVQSIHQLASDLGSLISRLRLVIHLAHPATSCALLILALEGHGSKPVPNLAELAAVLANRVAIQPFGVTSRYREICDLIENWTEEVPWLMKSVPSKERKKISAKGGQRERVARGLKDVLAFKEEIQRQKMEAPINLENGKRAGGGEDWVRRKRPKYGVCYEREVEQAKGSLLSPLSYAPTKQRSKRTVRQLQSFMLSPLGEPSAPPSRLDTLLALRGGEERIEDEELFEAGELEGMIMQEDVKKREEWWDEWVAWEKREISCRKGKTKRSKASEINLAVSEDDGLYNEDC